MPRQQEASGPRVPPASTDPSGVTQPADGLEAAPPAALESTECAPPEPSVRVEADLTTSSDHAWTSGLHVGRYQLERLIGRGSCGEVWAARDPVLGRPVAIKLPRPQRIRQCPWLPHAIWSEARIAARAASLNCCVPVYDFGWDDGTTVYIVMQLMEVSVAELMANGPLPVPVACRLTYAVARRLHRAHLEGLVHCDLKPSNLLLDTNGDPYPSDFSTTMPRALLAAERELFVGTLPYMAPEQLEGRAFEYDCRTDCYGLAVVLYEMIAGQRPFHGETPEELVVAIRRGKIKPLAELNRDVPDQLDRVVRAALGYYRHQRPPDLRAFGQAIRRSIRPRG